MESACHLDCVMHGGRSYAWDFPLNRLKKMEGFNDPFLASFDLQYWNSEISQLRLDLDHMMNDLSEDWVFSACVRYLKSG